MCQDMPPMYICTFLTAALETLVYDLTSSTQPDRNTPGAKGTGAQGSAQYRPAPPELIAYDSKPGRVKVSHDGARLSQKGTADSFIPVL